jgi:hypothetical protein
MSIRIISVIIISICAAMISTRGYPMANTLKPAHFEEGQTTVVKSFKIDSNGGTFAVDDTHTVVDGTIIEVPKGAVNKETRLSIGYNNGALTLPSGKASGAVIIVSVESISSFQNPIIIKVRFDPSINPKTIVGYEIDSEGRLHSLDIGPIEKDAGAVSFYSFKPLRFTWVYIF